MTPGLPHPSGHVLVVDDTPGPNGYTAVCTPHGRLGTWPARTGAVLAALLHGHEHGGDTTR